MTFEDLSIIPEIRKAIIELGFEHPMPVQEKVIPLLLNKENDIIALAQTGTGKTAAYGIPLIQESDIDKKVPQALVLSPTRELCVQIAGDLNDFSKYMDEIKVIPVYGGSSIDTQIRAIKKGAQIIVATPGRLMDLIKRRAINLSSVRRVVLDEADEMLNMGFLEDINMILEQIPKERITLLFSATMPDEISKITHKYMRNPIEVTIGSKNSGAENVKHICYVVHAKDRYLALKRIVDYVPGVYGIVFCRTRKETQEIADKLIQDGYNADALHGDLSQSQRDSVMQKFRSRNITLLVATDVAARGLDVNDLTHVINYNLPDDPDVYTHRSGRTGRSGKTGISVVIVHMKEKRTIQLIEKKIKKSFIFSKIPSGSEVCEKQLFNFIEKMEKVEVDHAQINSYLPAIFRKLEWLDKEDLITRFVSLEFNRFLEYYKNAKDINVNEEAEDYGKGREKYKSRERNSESGYTRLFINMGKLDGLFASQLIELINSNSKGLKVDIGRIDLFKSFSFFEVESSSADQLIEFLNKKTSFAERTVIVEKASEKKQGEQSDRGDRREYRGSKPSSGRSDRSFAKKKEYSRDSSDSSSRRKRDDSSKDNKRGGGDWDFKKRNNSSERFNRIKKRP